MRHNNTDIVKTELPDGQAEKARSENPGVETDWHPQPSSRLCLGHSVQRESILRSQGSSSGPLRDATAAQHGRSLDCRSGYEVRRFAPDRLSSAGGIPASWLER